MSRITEVNNLAIMELSNGNESVAQTLFRKNVQKKSCCLTLNNLGVYYSQYGMQLKNGKIQSAKKVGLNFLLKASAYGQDWRNYVSTATAELDFDNILGAYELLSKAYQLNSNELILYNMGCCLFRLKRFQEAITILEALCVDTVINCITKNGGQNPLLILAYCELELNHKQESINYLQRYRDAWKTEDSFDVFCLRYLCGMYEDALSECVVLLSEWYPTCSLLAMIADCVSNFPSSEVAINEAILREDRKLWNTMQKDLLFRTQKIQEYSYLPPLICLYYFIT